MRAIIQTVVQEYSTSIGDLVFGKKVKDLSVEERQEERKELKEELERVTNRKRSRKKEVT